MIIDNLFDNKNWRAWFCVGYFLLSTIGYLAEPPLPAWLYIGGLCSYVFIVSRSVERHYKYKDSQIFDVHASIQRYFDRLER